MSDGSIAMDWAARGSPWQVARAARRASIAHVCIVRARRSRRYDYMYWYALAWVA